jgi:N-acetyl-anhydromuramyl-L-alanine amidase AmpD
MSRSAVENTLRYSKVVERYAHFFGRPEVRLRFLNNTLALQTSCAAKLEDWLERHPFIKRSKLFNKHYERLLDLLLYRLIIQEINKYLPSSARERLQLLRQHKAPRVARLYFGFYQVRHAFHALGLVLVALSLFGVYSAVAFSAQRVNGYLARRYGKTNQTNSRAAGAGVAYGATATNFLPDYKPEKVWLVERKDNYERYSNGGRISTEYETDNHARAYRVLPHADGNVNASAQTASELHNEPAGIVYHTSESDLVSFTADNNESIETHTRGLLQYVQRNRSYNYVIDRFGQIYRIVRDEQAANHAGNSVWADKQGVYLGLNESFLGVCFETQTDAHEEQLTEAQLVAGRLLTQILRSRYQIDDADCTVHGLVSVNPDNMRVCYHHDWARNFPFAAMGLSDKYQVQPATISEFGFTYDDEIVEQLGGTIWPGAQTALDAFNQRAANSKLKPEELRRQTRERYRQQLELSRKLRAGAPEQPEAGRTPAQTSAPRT